MVNTYKRRSLKGVVLIMVVTVMLMLIILLLATMAVVSTAQNRYYTKFEENQAYYTARSALDVYVDNLFTDKTYLAYDNTGIREYKYTDGASTQTVDMKQGLAMQLDTYRIKAYADTMEHYNALTDTQKADPDNSPYKSKHWVNATGIFTSGTPEYDYYEGTSGPDLDYIEYEIEFPEVKDGSSAYGGIVDTDSSGKQKAKIRIEVLARTYNGHSAAYPASPTSAEETTDKAAIASGERFKDQVYLKVTSNVEFQGVDGYASIVFCSPETENQFTSALTATGAIHNADNALIIEGFAAPTGTAFPNEGVFVGKSYTGGSVGGSGGKITFSMSKGECSYFESITNVPNDFYPASLGGVTADKDVPVIFVNGNCTFSNQVSWGGGSTGTIDKRVDLVVNGDLTIKNFNVNGNVIVKGNLNITGDDIYLAPGCKIIVGGDISVSSPVNIRDKIKNTPIYCNGNFNVSSPGDMNMDPSEPSKTYTNLYMQAGKTFAGTLLEAFGTGLKIGIGVNDSGHLAKLSGFDSDAFKYLDLKDPNAPSNIKYTSEGWETYIPRVNAGGDGVEATHGDSDYMRRVPNDMSKYCNYWKRDSTAPYDYKSPLEYISAEEMAGTPTKAQRDIGSYTEMNFSSVPAGAITINSGGTYSVAGTLDYYLTDCSNATINFTGTGTANIYVKSGVSMSNDSVIIADDATTLNFYFPAGSYSWDCAVVNASVYNAFVNQHELCFGSDSNTKPCLKAPKIKYYMSSGCTISARMGKCMFTGYIYAPDAKIDIKGGWQKSTCSYYYNDGLITHGNGVTMSGNNNPAIVGAIVCKDFKTQNNPAICYIRDEDTPAHGDPFWSGKEAYYYTRT